MSLLDTIQIAGQDILTAVDAVLPILEQALPVVAASAGPIGLGVSAAAALLPLLAKIPIGQTYTVEVQQGYLNRVQALVLLDFTSKVWQQHDIPADPAPPVPAPTA